MASSSHTGDAKEETSHMDSHRVFPTDEELATYKISNTSGARWRWKELADLSAVADLVDGNLSAARVSLNSIGWDSSFVAGSAGVGEVIGNVAVWSIAAVASYGVNRQRVQSGDVRLNERAIIGQTTAGLRERIAVRYTRLGAGVDRSTPELYFDFALFLDSLALDYLRKRSRYINSVLGVSMETELSVLRSFVAPNDRSSNMVSFYTRCWLRLFDVIWCEAHGVALAWGGGANGVVNVNVFSNGATWTAHSRPALMRCQAGASVSLVVDSLTDVEIDALFIIAAQFGVVTDFQSGNTQYVPYSSRYEFGAMTFEVWCFEAWVRLSGAGTHAMNANNPHAAVRSGVPVGSEDLRNILHKIATHRVEQSQLASAFGVAAGLFVGRPFILRNVAAVNGVAARSFIPARPVITALTMRMPVDLAPLFPMFAQDAYVDPANCNDALLLSSMTTGELYVLAAHIGKCTGYAYSTAMALLNMSGGAMVRDTRRSQAVRSDLGLLTTTTLAASSLDEIARASYIRTFYLAPQPFQFGGVSSGFSPDFNTEGNNTRSIQKFVQGMSLPVTVLSQEVLQSASALPYTSTLPLVGDRAVARSLVTQVGTTWRVGFPGSEALIPGDMETFEPELLLRTFLVGELCTAQFPITMVHKEAVTRPDMVDWVAGPDLQILGGPLPGTFMAQESTAITRLGSGDWRRARVNVPAHHAGRFLTSMEFEGTRNRIALIWPMAGVTDSYLSGPVIFSTSKITQGSGMLRGDSVTQLSTAQMVKECVGRAKNLEQLLASIEEVRSSIVARYDRAKAHLSARMAELHLPRPLIPAKRTFSQVASDVLVDATPPPEPSDGASNL